jgi:hypothetical protein
MDKQGKGEWLRLQDEAEEVLELKKK